MSNKNTVLLLPAYNPPESLVAYVAKMRDAGYTDVIIVDDGSRKKREFIFAELKKLGCTVLRHWENRGKGAALKTGLSYYTEQYGGKRDGVITINADSAVRLEDLDRIADILREEKLKNEEKMVLGSRIMSKAETRHARHHGGRLARGIVKLLFNIDLQDVWTGLRGVPDGKVEKCLAFKENGYAYEMAVLLGFEEEGFYEIGVPAESVDPEAEVHYRPFVDTMLIYYTILKKLMKFAAISMMAAVLDLIFFWVFTHLVLPESAWQIALGTVMARVISASFNYYFSRKYVFGKDVGRRKSAGQFFVLTVCQCIISAVLVSLLEAVFGQAILFKIVVDIALFFAAYWIQDRFIFR